MNDIRSYFKDKKLLIGLIVALFLSIVSSLYISKRFFVLTKVKPVTSATINTSMGSFKIKFRYDSPRTVENFIVLAKEGFYNDTKIHRVITEFLIEGGDPLSKFNSSKASWGKGGPGYTFPDEILESDKMSRGVVAMVNSGPDTNGSQFFIITKDADWLDGQHTIFADVVEGMEIVDTISTVPIGQTGIPIDDIIIRGVELN